MRKEKVLYFEGAGMDIHGEDLKLSDVGNYRIRTAFRNDEGQEFYVEVSAGWHYEGTKRSYAVLSLDHSILRNERAREKWEQWDENKNRYISGYRYSDSFHYSRETIVNFINKNYNCSFSSMEVLGKYHGYRAHGVSYEKNIMNDFNVDYDRAKQAEKIDKYFYDYIKKNHGKRFPNHSCWFEGDTLNITVAYNCYNHRLEIENVYDFDFNYQEPSEETLALARGKYGAKGGRV